MVQTPVKSSTLEEFLSLPETEPASEFIDGEIIQKPMPQGKHSRLQDKLLRGINDVVETQQSEIAFPELRCTFDGKSIVPDISVFVWDRIPVDENDNIANVFEAVPDWVIEIVSPEQDQAKLTRKILRCLEQGCQLGWLVNPDDFSVFAYPAKQQPSFYDLEAPDEVIPVPEFARDFQLTVGTLFSWLKRPQKQ